MRPGDLTKRVTLQYERRLADGMGGWVTSWADAAHIWAAIWPVSASEQVQDAQTVMTISHRIRIRYRSDVRSSWKIKYGDRYFTIVGLIDPNEKHALLDLLCKEAA